MILYTPEDHGCAYSIDSEGTLFYIPIHTDGTLNLNEIDEVDYYDARDCGYEDEVKEIHRISALEVLDTMRLAVTDAED